MAALYRGMDRAALDAAYNNGAAVKDSAQIVSRWEARSTALRRTFPGRWDLRYGDAERNRIDLLEAKPGAPLFAFIHGGYWQSRAKEIYTFLADGLLPHGVSTALIGYTLAPQKRLDGIVAEIGAALDFLDRDLVLSGWSAGGHLTAMQLGHRRVRAGLPISGLFDLEPMRLCYINEKLGLDADEARRNSPMLLPGPAKPLAVAYGGDELPELQRQSVDYAGACGARLERIEGRNHFTVLDELASPDGRLARLVLDLLR